MVETYPSLSADFAVISRECDDALTDLDAVPGDSGDVGFIDRPASPATAVGGPDLDFAPRTDFLDDR